MCSSDAASDILVFSSPSLPFLHLPYSAILYLIVYSFATSKYSKIMLLTSSFLMKLHVFILFIQLFIFGKTSLISCQFSQVFKFSAPVVLEEKVLLYHHPSLCFIFYLLFLVFYVRCVRHMRGPWRSWSLIPFIQ